MAFSVAMGVVFSTFMYASIHYFYQTQNRVNGTHRKPSRKMLAIAVIVTFLCVAGVVNIVMSL